MYSQLTLDGSITLTNASMTSNAPLTNATQEHLEPTPGSVNDPKPQLHLGQSCAPWILRGSIYTTETNRVAVLLVIDGSGAAIDFRELHGELFVICVGPILKNAQGHRLTQLD